MRTLCPVRFGPLLAVFCSLILPGPSLARAADSPLSGTPAATRIGFDGLYKLGRWTPVEIEVTVARPVDVQLQIEAPDPYGSIAVFPTDKVHLATGTHRLTGHFQNGRLGGGIAVRLRTFVDDEPQTVPVAMAGISTEPLTQTPVLVATLGAPAGLSAQTSEAADGEAADPLLRVVAFGRPDELPSEAISYDSLDVMIIAGSYDLSPERSEALRQWVQRGGHLIVSTGAAVTDYAKSPLAEWVPVAVAPEPQQLRELGGLERFAGRNERLRVSREGVPAARIEKWQGRELVTGGPFGPLLVRVPYGFGRVSFLAVDLNRPPLADWPATEAIVRRIVGGTTPAGTTEAPSRRQLARSGITDLATQLRVSQESFPDVGRLSLWSVMGLLVAYLLVIGPLDYFLVHRVLKRPKMTWITFPVLVIAAGALAVRGAQTTNGEQIRFNQIDLVDIDAETGLCRVRSWVNLYSPDTQRYQVDVGPAEWMQVSPGAVEQGAPQESPRVVWSGVPESSYGGMYRTGGFEVGRSEYEFAPEAATVTNLPVQIWSTRGLTAQWQGPAGSRVSAALRSSGVGRLAGTISHQFEAPLENWMLAYGSRAYLPTLRRGDGVPAPLRPGEELRPENRLPVRTRELAGFLTGTTAIPRRGAGDAGPEDILDQQAKYDPLSPSYSPESRILQIMRMISFHQAAGGQDYTGLQNSMLRELDLSEHATDLNRAVLFGRMETPAARLELNGKDVEPDRHFTFVRIVLPVTIESKPQEIVNPQQLLEERQRQVPDDLPLGPPAQ